MQLVALILKMICRWLIVSNGLQFVSGLLWVPVTFSGMFLLICLLAP
jgi:hypothetical protein